MFGPSVVVQKKIRDRYCFIIPGISPEKAYELFVNESDISAYEIIVQFFVLKRDVALFKEWPQDVCGASEIRQAIVAVHVQEYADLNILLSFTR